MGKRPKPEGKPFVDRPPAGYRWGMPWDGEPIIVRLPKEPKPPKPLPRLDALTVGVLRKIVREQRLKWATDPAIDVTAMWGAEVALERALRAMTREVRRRARASRVERERKERTR